MKKFQKFTVLFLLSVLFLGAFTISAEAKKKDTKDKKDKHPITVLKAELDREGFSTQEMGIRRTCTVWVKNLSHDTQKDVKVNLKVRYKDKVIEDLEEKIEEMDASERVFVNFKWQDFDMKPKYNHQIWITYTNDEGKEVTFECEPPVW